MRLRSGSAESVVLPVPDSPKNTDASPVRADVDRRVHRQHALVGHEVVHDRERALLDLAGVLGADDEDLHPPRWTRIAVPVRVPSVAGSAWNDGTQMIVKFGSNPASCSSVGRRNRLRAKMLAQAVSV